MARVTSDLHVPGSPSLCSYMKACPVYHLSQNPFLPSGGKGQLTSVISSDCWVQLQPLHLSVICEVKGTLSLTKIHSWCKTKAVPGFLSSEGSRALLCLKFPVDSWPAVTQKGTYSLSEYMPGSSAESVEPAKSPRAGSG